MMKLPCLFIKGIFEVELLRLSCRPEILRVCCRHSVLRHFNVIVLPVNYTATRFADTLVIFFHFPATGFLTEAICELV
jgi:hypothetical protein